jgi:peptidoglycan/LPS O-acetylase OafA/YrhL
LVGSRGSSSRQLWPTQRVENGFDMTSTGAADGLIPVNRKREQFEPKPLSELLSGRHANALNAVRLVLASAVIFSHAFPLGGWGQDKFFNLFRQQENLGGVAVIGFFAISGYLITKSGANKDVLQFIWARVLRIFPAFWLVLLVGVFAVGPMIWAIEGRQFSEYFVLGGGTAASYFLGNWNLTIQQWGIFNIFTTTTPYGLETGGSVFNGSLWTLQYEWGAYILIAVIVLFGAMRYSRVLIPALLALSMFAQAIRLGGSSGFTVLYPVFVDGLMVNLLTAFMWGALFAIYSNRIHIDDRLGLLSLAVTAYSLLFGGFGIVGFPAFAYFLFWVSVRVPNWVKRIGAKHDYSYGIYLYGFLVQQVLAYFGWHHFGYAAYTISALIITTGLAMLSWHLLERPALAIKDWGPGKGLRYWRERFATRLS